MPPGPSDVVEARHAAGGNQRNARDGGGQFAQRGQVGPGEHAVGGNVGVDDGAHAPAPPPPGRGPARSRRSARVQPLVETIPLRASMATAMRSAPNFSTAAFHERERFAGRVWPITTRRAPAPRVSSMALSLRRPPPTWMKSGLLRATDSMRWRFFSSPVKAPVEIDHVQVLRAPCRWKSPRDSGRIGAVNRRRPRRGPAPAGRLFRHAGRSPGKRASGLFRGQRLFGQRHKVFQHLQARRAGFSRGEIGWRKDFPARSPRRTFRRRCFPAR